MTHTYLPSDISKAPPLPIEFYERSAYMRLYSARQHGDQYWPASMFGTEIAALLARDHAEAYGGGYRLTMAGVTHWEAYVRQWEASTSVARARKGVLPLSVRLILMMQNGAWYGLTALVQDCSRSHAFDVCERLEAQGYIAKRRRESDRAWEFQITEAGRIKAREFEGEKVS